MFHTILLGGWLCCELTLLFSWLPLSDLRFGKSDRIRRCFRRLKMANLLGRFQYGKFPRDFLRVDSTVLPAEVYSACVVHVSWSLEWHDHDLQLPYPTFRDETQGQG